MVVATSIHPSLFHPLIRLTMKECSAPNVTLGRSAENRSRQPQQTFAMCCCHSFGRALFAEQVFLFLNSFDNLRSRYSPRRSNRPLPIELFLYDRPRFDLDPGCLHRRTGVHLRDCSSAIADGSCARVA